MISALCYRNRKVLTSVHLDKVYFFFRTLRNHRNVYIYSLYSLDLLAIVEDVVLLNLNSPVPGTDVFLKRRVSLSGVFS